MTVEQLIKELQQYHENDIVIDYTGDEVQTVKGEEDWMPPAYKHLKIKAVRLM